MKAIRSSCRIYVHLARNGKSAVVFRRGPSKQVLLLTWNLMNDELESGQWLKGRIYERRCDLSPDGQLLLYLAAKWKAPIESWSAISRPPYFTALALWPNMGAWGGGGVIESNGRVKLNHTLSHMQLASGFKWPNRIDLSRVAQWAGSGEDHPIEQFRMMRDGWRFIAAGKSTEYQSQGVFRWEYSEPHVCARTQPSRVAKRAVELRRELRGIGKRDGAWYNEDFVVARKDGTTLRVLQKCDWADWQLNGDLLFALSGQLFRLRHFHAQEESTADPLAGAICVSDLRPLRFSHVVSPSAARNWPIK
jgi:hypothetical protein